MAALVMSLLKTDGATKNMIIKRVLFISIIFEFLK